MSKVVMRNGLLRQGRAKIGEARYVSTGIEEPFPTIIGRATCGYMVRLPRTHLLHTVHSRMKESIRGYCLLHRAELDVGSAYLRYMLTTNDVYTLSVCMRRSGKEEAIVLAEKLGELDPTPMSVAGVRESVMVYENQGTYQTILI